MVIAIGRCVILNGNDKSKDGGKYQYESCGEDVWDVNNGSSYFAMVVYSGGYNVGK